MKKRHYCLVPSGIWQLSLTYGLSGSPTKVSEKVGESDFRVNPDYERDIVVKGGKQSRREREVVLKYTNTNSVVKMN